ncbi:MAG: glycoside hydrolase family 16 protein [Planctomycetota bacterium]
MKYSFTNRRVHTTLGLIGLVAMVTVSLVESVAIAGPVIAPGWGAPVFEDRFDGNSIDHGKWQVGNFANEHNNEQQYYHPDQVLVYDGGLHLWAERDDQWTYGRNYNSGQVRTWQEWRYGRFEVRAKIPRGQGFWPAIWLLPRNAAWPVGGELDIMENVGSNTYFVKGSYHYNWAPGWPITSNADYITGQDFAAGYHDYAVEWEADQIRFYVDGNQYHTVYNPIQPDPVPMSLILNLAVGGDWPGSPDWTTPLPSSFDIDYVRIWERQETPAPPTSLILDAGFEDNGGAMDAWEVFGDSIDNVFSDWGTPLDGERSLKLYGQFTDEDNVAGVFQNVEVTGGTLLTARASALVRSEDSIVGTGNEALMKIEFYRQAGADYGSSDFLGETIVTLADGSSPEDTWSDFELEAATPNDAVEARLTFAFIQPGTNDAGSVFIDSASLTASLSGDYNGNGQVEQGDLNLVLNNWGRGSISRAPAGWINDLPDGLIDQGELNAVLTNWGSSSAPNFASPIPEPIAAAVTALGVFSMRRMERVCERD